MNTPRITLGQASAFCLMLAASLSGCAPLAKGDDIYKTNVTPAYNTPLLNTRWSLRQIDGAAILPSNTEQQPYLLLNSSGQQLEGMGGCNRLIGSYEQLKNQLKMMVASTRMACLQNQDQETRFIDGLSATVGYKIEGSRLSLQDNQQKTRLLFAAEVVQGSNQATD